MSEVKIYTVVSDELSPPVIGESFCTDMVQHSDYATLEQKLTDMAVQLANAEIKCRELSSKAMDLVCEASLVYSKYNDTQMPDRDLVDMQTLQEMHDLCKGAEL
ncbi:hypothetical protein AH633_002478 [Salmonella enterica subsp. enterica]|nr:hypothetical protein [Salmonella enterica subsp. enterica]EAQ5899786.1 hypothetical protein [Salmonella enterica]EGI5966879.1 hypothetical protein [Salmonella enterica subsp. enterica serovar Brunei]EAX6555776.1 hypothetical protein [Salmonella enterica]EBA4614498.1 hypothetical protein [Salmonella enterica]